MRTVTGLFDTYGDASRAVNELQAAGISSEDISIVSNGTVERAEDDSLAADPPPRTRMMKFVNWKSVFFISSLSPV